MAKMPKEGFLKIVKPVPLKLSSSQKVALLRKGNELFKQGSWEAAKKIFLTLSNTHGIIQVADYHYSQGDYWEAYRLYKLAPAPQKTAHMVEKMARIIKEWIKE